MSDQHRAAWGNAREDAVWWPGAISTNDQSNLHHQQIINQHHQQNHMQQQQQIHQVVVQQQQPQVLTSTSSAPGTQQLFSYKMASGFPATSVAVSSSNPSYDYRLAMGQGMGTTPGTTQWWYATAGQNTLENLQQQQQQQLNQQSQQQQISQQQTQQQQSQHQNLHNVHSTPNSNQSHHVQPVSNSKRGKGGDNKPRGRMTAYAFFVQTCREEHKKKHPEESVIFAEFSRKCAERWKTMLDKEKKRFHEMAEKDKQRYDLEMSNYVPPKGVVVGRGKKRKHMKDPNAPKRSLSAFFWFCHDERNKVKAANPEYGVGDIAKELGRKWSDCDPETKGKYEAMADKDKQRYEREMQAYKLKCRNEQQGIVTPVAAPVVVNHVMNMQQHHAQGGSDDDDDGDDDVGED